MTARHTVIDSPLGELTLVAEDDTLTGVYFRHHWHPPTAGALGQYVEPAADELLQSRFYAQSGQPATVAVATTACAFRFHGNSRCPPCFGIAPIGQDQFFKGPMSLGFGRTARARRQI